MIYLFSNTHLINSKIVESLKIKKEDIIYLFNKCKHYKLVKKYTDDIRVICCLNKETGYHGENELIDMETSEIHLMSFRKKNFDNFIKKIEKRRINDIMVSDFTNNALKYIFNINKKIALRTGFLATFYLRSKFPKNIKLSLVGFSFTSSVSTKNLSFEHGSQHDSLIEKNILVKYAETNNIIFKYCGLKNGNLIDKVLQSDIKNKLDFINYDDLIINYLKRNKLIPENLSENNIFKKCPNLQNEKEKWKIYEYYYYNFIVKNKKNKRILYIN